MIWAAAGESTCWKGRWHRVAQQAAIAQACALVRPAGRGLAARMLAAACGGGWLAAAVWLRCCWLAGCGCGGCWLSLAVGCALAVGGVRGVSSVGGVWHSSQNLDLFEYSYTGVTPDFGVHFHKMNL